MDSAISLIVIGGLLLVGLALDALGRLTHVPRITLLAAFGLLIGPSGVDALPGVADGWRDLAADVALTMIAFLLGGELTVSALKAHGRAILAVSLAVVAATFVAVAGGLAILGFPPVLALLLAGIGLATDPAATRDVIRQIKAKGPVTTVVQGVVAIDDAWGVIVFSVLLGGIAAAGAGVAAGAVDGLLQVFGACLLGLAVGAPAAYLSGRVRPGEPTLAEALGLVLLLAGLSLWLDVSFLLAAMTAGCVIANLAKHHDYAFHEIEHISWPFLILFFVLAGALVDLSAAAEVWPLIGAFIATRIVGRVLGGIVGARIWGETGAQGARLGLALTPQAGVALGMALVAAEAAPEFADTLIAAAVGAMIFFELAGPLATRWALQRAGEASADKDEIKDGI